MKKELKKVELGKYTHFIKKKNGILIYAVIIFDSDRPFKIKESRTVFIIKNKMLQSGNCTNLY